MRNIVVKFEFKVEDLWIGAFWRTTALVAPVMPGWTKVELWVCFVPCFPLHITWYRYTAQFRVPEGNEK